MRVAARLSRQVEEGTELLSALAKARNPADFEAYVRGHKPSAASIAIAILIAAERGKNPRGASVAARVRKAGVTSYAELKSRLPELLKDDRVSKATLREAISRQKREKTLLSEQLKELSVVNLDIALEDLGFPRPQVEAWLRELEQSGLIERDLCPEVPVSDIAHKMQRPPIEPEDDTFYDDVSAFADTSLSRLGVYLTHDRISHRLPSFKTVDRTLALVVEDDPDQRALAVRRLTSAGYRADTADCVAELLRYLDAKAPDAIFLDINLPDGDGFDVLAGLRRHPLFTHLPIVMLTARTERADIAKGLALAADAYVTKPYGSNTLEYVLRCLMKQEVQASTRTPTKKVTHNTAIYRA